MSDVAVAGIPQRTSSAPAARPKTARHELSAEVVAGAGAYTALKEEWQRLVALQPGRVPFQTTELLEVWAKHFAKSAELATIVVRENGRAVLIWPLAIEWRGLLRIAEGAGAPIAQYDDILVDPETHATSAFRAALQALKDICRTDLVAVHRARADSALRMAAAEFVPVCNAEAAPFVDLADGTTAALGKIKSSVTRKQRKRVRRFMKSGDVHFEVARSSAEAESWLAEALRMKRAWLKETGRISRAFLKPEAGDCLIELARRLDGTDGAAKMMVSRVSLDGHIAAIEAAIRHRGAYHLYLRAFAPVFSAYGPGNVLTEHMLGWSAANGIGTYDMLAPRSRSKREWQSGEVQVFDYALPLTIKGRLYTALVVKRLAPMLRRAFYALPLVVRSTAARILLPA